MQGRSATYEDDTISLVDLIAVVVRHRTLIVVGTVAIAVLAVLYSYIGPRLGVAPEREVSYTAEQRIVTAHLPAALAEHVSFDPVAVVRETLAGSDASVTEARSGDTVTFTVSVSAGDRQSAEQRLGTQVAVSRDQFAAAVGETLQPVVASYDAAIDEARRAITAVSTDLLTAGLSAAGGQNAQSVGTYAETVGVAGVQTLVDTITLRNRIAGLLSQPAALITVSAPTVDSATTGNNPSMLVVIATITAFFLAVFLAFVLEYIRRVRMDPEEVDKLRAAWRRQ